MYLYLCTQAEYILMEIKKWKKKYCPKVLKYHQNCTHRKRSNIAPSNAAILRLELKLINAV